MFFLSPLKALRTYIFKKVWMHLEGPIFLKKIHKPIELACISSGHSKLDHTLENFG
jgi:hypothetical protein